MPYDHDMGASVDAEAAGPAFVRAPEVQRVAEELIGRYHHHLREVQILYLFTNKQPKKSGKTVFGKMVKLSDLQRTLSAEDFEASEGYDWVMVITRAAWSVMNRDQRTALVDHELCHANAKSDGTPAYRAHDLEEFTEVVERHGFWWRDVEDFAEAVGKQLGMFDQVGNGRVEADRRVTFKTNAGEVETTVGGLSSASVRREVSNLVRETIADARNEGSARSVEALRKEADTFDGRLAEPVVTP